MCRKLSLLMLFVVLCAQLPATTINVPTDYATIQAGINAATSGDIVLVAEGTYYENINFKGKAITVASHFWTEGDTTHINNTIIDGSKPANPDSGSVVFFVSGEDTTSVICGFTITGGTGTLYDSETRVGGGLFCNSSGCKALVNRIINNTAAGPGANGGGLSAMPEGSKAYVVLRDNQITHNTITANTDFAWGGGVVLFCNGILANNLISHNSVVHNATTTQAASGGLACRSLSSDPRTVIVKNNKIIYNSVVSYSDNVPAALGGGVTIRSSQGRFTKNEVSHNEIWVKADQYGCGAGVQLLELPDSFIIEANIILENAVIQGNGYGGGFNIHTNSSPILVNNIIDGNSATNGGAFVIGGNSAPKLINNTAINHKATTGAGIYSSGSSTVYLMNTILWNNQAVDHTVIHIESGTVQAAYCDIQGGWGGVGNINVDPLFADAEFKLADNSLCLGAGIATFDFGGGINCCCPATDRAGGIRPNPAGSPPDMGAMESPLGVIVAEQADYEIPHSYFLAQNYPNPCNPSTTIEFTLPKSTFVTLKVYDLLGEEVATLVAEQREAGIHKINWDAGGLASGMYLYRLEAEELVQTKKLILMR